MAGVVLAGWVLAGGVRFARVLMVFGDLLPDFAGRKPFWHSDAPFATGGSQRCRTVHHPEQMMDRPARDFTRFGRFRPRVPVGTSSDINDEDGMNGP